ncbi:MAG: hypothetical protein ACYC64_03635 [Armatimonadota bacterium]
MPTSDLFVRYATDYPDKAHLIDIIMQLYESNDCGIRDGLIKAAHRFLAEPDLRLLADRIEKRAQLSGDSRNWLYILPSIAQPRKL